MSIMIDEVSPEDAWELREELAAIYAQAFGYEQEQANQFRDQSLRHVLEYDGARVLLARDGELPIGFLYGYTYQHSHWWPMHVGPALADAGYGDLLEDAFELVELEILPEYQGRSVGSWLVARLIETTDHAHILLNTLASPENRALNFYRRLGFRSLLPNFQYIEYGDEHAIMAWSRSA